MHAKRATGRDEGQGIFLAGEDTTLLSGILHFALRWSWPCYSAGFMTADGASSCRRGPRASSRRTTSSRTADLVCWCVSLLAFRGLFGQCLPVPCGVVALALALWVVLRYVSCRGCVCLWVLLNNAIWDGSAHAFWKVPHGLWTDQNYETLGLHALLNSSFVPNTLPYPNTDQSERERESVCV